MSRSSFLSAKKIAIHTDEISMKVRVALGVLYSKIV